MFCSGCMIKFKYFIYIEYFITSRVGLLSSSPTGDSSNAVCNCKRTLDVQLQLSSTIIIVR